MMFPTLTLNQFSRMAHIKVKTACKQFNIITNHQWKENCPSQTKPIHPQGQKRAFRPFPFIHAILTHQHALTPHRRLDNANVLRLFLKH